MRARFEKPTIDLSYKGVFDQSSLDFILVNLPFFYTVYTVGNGPDFFCSYSLALLRASEFL